MLREQDWIASSQELLAMTAGPLFHGENNSMLSAQSSSLPVAQIRRQIPSAPDVKTV